MPAFRPHATFLREAIESVMRQTHPHWTLLVHDDPSDTDTEAIVRPYLHDERISFGRSKKRLGIGGNWNACLRQARGDCVQFLFQDDVWREGYLAACVAALGREPSAGMVMVHHPYRADGDRAEHFMAAAGYDVLPALRREAIPPGKHDGTALLLAWLERGLRPNLIGEPSFVMLRRSVTEQAGTFLEDMTQGLDVEYWTRALQKTSLVAIDENLGFFRVHADGASMRNEEAGQGLYDRLRCFETLLHALPYGTLRRTTERAVAEQLGVMARKFFARLRGGKRVDGGGAGGALSFSLRHPLLLIRGLLTLAQPERAPVL